MNKVLVFQTWGIGDMIMATPMMSALRQRLSDAHITIVAGSRASADVVDGSPFCNDVWIMLPGKMSAYQLIRTFRGFRKEHFDFAVVCTRISPQIARLLKLFSGVEIIAGDSVPPKPWGYTHWCPVELDLHRVIANLNILQLVFPDAQVASTYFHLDQESIISRDQLWLKWDFDDRNVLGIHPGAGSQQKNKRFPPEKFQLVIRMFLDNFPEAQVVIFIGPDDQELVPHFSSFDGRVVLARNLTLRTVGGVISKVRVLLAGDSGLGHIAAALGVPVVTLAGPTQIKSTRPWGNNNTIVRTAENLNCMPCYDDMYLYDHCKHISCMKTISEAQVLKVLSQLF